jgi:hypothetical protein
MSININTINYHTKQSAFTSVTSPTQLPNFISTRNHGRALQGLRIWIIGVGQLANWGIVEEPSYHTKQITDAAVPQINVCVQQAAA